MTDPDQRTFRGNFQADIAFPKPGANPETMTARVLIAYDNEALAEKLDNSIALLVGELDRDLGKAPKLIATLVTGKEKVGEKQYFHASADYPDQIKVGKDVTIQNLSLTFTYSDPSDQIAETTFQNILQPSNQLSGGGSPPNE